MITPALNSNGQSRSNVLNLDSYRLSPLKNRKQGFDGLPRVITESGTLNLPQRFILGLICSAIGSHGELQRSKSWFCQRSRLAYSTVCRHLLSLQKIGFIETSGSGINFKIFLTDLCYFEDARQIKNTVKARLKTDTQVLTCEKKLLTSENFTNILERKILRKEQPPPDTPPKPPEKPTETNLPSANLFSPGQIKKMGSYAKPIIENCKALIEKNTRFNPMQIVGKAINNGNHPGAIDEILASFAKSKNAEKLNPDQFWALYNHQIKIKNGNHNARDIERDSNARKSDMADMVKIFQGLGFGR